MSALIMPRSATMQASLDPEALAQPLDYRQQQRHVGGIAGHQEGGDRPVGIIEHDAEHDLIQMPAVVFGMAALAQALAAGTFEPQRRGVEKCDRDGAEQRLAMAIERLFDRLMRAAPAVSTAPSQAIAL